MKIVCEQYESPTRGVWGKYEVSMGTVCRECHVSMAEDSIMKGICMPEACRQYTK
ncbi:MAG: hypothetical protein WD824_02980 [Cyclobacteriaceae bacterium]